MSARGKESTRRSDFRTRRAGAGIEQAQKQEEEKSKNESESGRVKEPNNNDDADPLIAAVALLRPTSAIRLRLDKLVESRYLFIFFFSPLFPFFFP